MIATKINGKEKEYTNHAQGESSGSPYKLSLVFKINIRGVYGVAMKPKKNISIHLTFSDEKYSSFSIIKLQMRIPKI